MDVKFKSIPLQLRQNPGWGSHKAFGDHTSPILRRWDVTSTEEMVAMIDRHDNWGRKPSVFWTTFPYTGPVGQQGYMSSKCWATEKFGRNNFYQYEKFF